MAQNGTKLLTFIGSLLGSFLAVTYAIYQLVYAPLSSALASECGKRELADAKLTTELILGIKEQMLINQQILVSLAEIKEQIKKI